MTWRTRKGRQPYLEFLVNWVDEERRSRIKHFYVGVQPSKRRESVVLREAMEFRERYEARRMPSGGSGRR